jgi:hypothetical protein
VLCCVGAAGGAGPARADVVSFGPSGFEQSFTVPAGVTSVHVVAIGARGGGGAGTGGDSGQGGFGARATADIPVAPGQVLYVEVGSHGAAALGSSGGAAGFNGGGAGGAGIGLLGGASGGGASDLRTLPRSVTDSLTSRLIVAGGGGGGGGFSGPNSCPSCQDNPYGGPAGGDGAGVEPVAIGGKGATPSQPGAGGSRDGQDGSLGTGGGGGTPNTGNNGGGGGGGGGAYGGGGGGGCQCSGGGVEGAGGGGGSSAFASNDTNTSVGADATGRPSVTISFTASSGGGGGGGGGGGPLPLPTAAVRATISALLQTNPVFRVGLTSTPLFGRTSRSFPRGTTFSFRLNEPATVTVRIQRKLPGRLVGRVCKPPSRLLIHRPRCTRLVTKATLRRSARVGLNKIAFSGRIRGHALPAGVYRAAFTAANTAGTSALRALNFRIVPG